MAASRRVLKAVERRQRTLAHRLGNRVTRIGGGPMAAGQRAVGLVRAGDSLPLGHNQRQVAARHIRNLRNATGPRPKGGY
jgi:hypothetical protein